MNYKLLGIPIIFLFFFTFPVHAQSEVPFGKLTDSEKELVVYEKDSTAKAIVLYEKGEVFFIAKDNRPYIAKTYHTKIKILDKIGFEQGNISITLMGTKEAHEDIVDIKAVTHNGSLKEYLDEEKIYISNSTPGIVEVNFTFPKIKVGSVLEYKYTLLSPYVNKLEGWVFQSSIPKVYSEFTASIPFNYVYKRVLVGNLELCTNEVKAEDCFIALGNSFVFLCENIKYAMEDIPAFKPDEEFMLGTANYISRLDFELSNINGENKNRKDPITWSDIDAEFKKDKNIGKQLRYKGYFGRKIPDYLLKGKDDLEKAVNIYNFVRNHYTWNGGFGIYGEARVKDAFNEKSGNIAEINISLINLLNSVGIESNMFLMSPRQISLPKKTYPVMSDFNYIIAKAKISGKDYLLDASSKYHPFGILPFRALNHYGRVMDFSDGSYWHDIEPYKNNLYQVRVHAEFNSEAKEFKGIFDILNLGYNAIELNEERAGKSLEDYTNTLNLQFRNNFETSDYIKIENRSNDKKVSEQLKFSLSTELINDNIYFNPFLIQIFKQNPFLAEERRYPVDLGYPRRFKYQLNLNIPEEYEIIEIPEKKVIQLGENLASLKYYYLKKDNNIMLFFDLNINNTYYIPSDYKVLHEMFKLIMRLQENTLLVLSKKQV